MQNVKCENNVGRDSLRQVKPHTYLALQVQPHAIESIESIHT